MIQLPTDTHWRTFADAGVQAYQQGDYVEAEELLLAAEEEGQKLGETSAYYATGLNDLGLCLMDQRKLDEARSRFEKALAIRRKLSGNESPDVADVCDNLGVLSLREGKFQEAEASLSKALLIREKNLGAENQQVATSLTHLGQLYIAEKKPQEAEPQFKRAMADQVAGARRQQRRRC